MNAESPIPIVMILNPLVPLKTHCQSVSTREPFDNKTRALDGSSIFAQLSRVTLSQPTACLKGIMTGTGLTFR